MLRPRLRSQRLWPNFLPALNCGSKRWALALALISSGARAQSSSEPDPRLASERYSGQGLQKNQLRVFSIRAAVEKNYRNCSATFIKVGGRCRLLTAAHCTPSLNATLDLALDPNYSNENSLFNSRKFKESTIQKVEVARIDTALDLSELKVPAGLEPICQDLQEFRQPQFNDRDSNRVISYRAMGYVGGQAVARYSRDLAWPNGAVGPSSSRLTFMGQGARLLEISYLRVTPGMSGGPIDSNWEEFIGITSQLVMFQDRSYIVPFDLILSWLEKPSEKNSSSTSLAAATESPFRNGSLPAYHLAARNDRDIGGSNSHGDGGSNSHGDGGSNSHGDGGGNSHGDGDDTLLSSLRDLRLKDPALLAPFREPPEGIINPANSSERILATGEEQIDGLDDFYLKAQASSKGAANPKNFKTRPVDGYPEPKIRKDLLKRLDGVYLSFNAFYEGATQGPVNYRNIYTEDSSVPEGWKRSVRGGPIVSIDLDRKKKKLTFEISTHPIGQELETVQVPAEKIEFQLSEDPESKTITLSTVNGFIMSCDNRNYLKLICVGPTAELALSMMETQNKQLSFRFTRRVVYQGKNVVDYIFGRLAASKEPKKWRD